MLVLLLSWWNNCIFQASDMSTRQPKEEHHWKYAENHSYDAILVESDTVIWKTHLLYSLHPLLWLFPKRASQEKRPACLFGTGQITFSTVYRKQSGYYKQTEPAQHEASPKHLAAAFSLVMIQASREDRVQGSNIKTTLVKKRVR